MSVFTAIFFKRNHLILGCIFSIYSLNISVFAEANVSKEGKTTEVSSDETVDIKQTSTKEKPSVEKTELKRDSKAIENDLPSDNKHKGAKQYVGKPKVVYMVFTDGPSEIETGFKEFFAEKKIPIDYIERDCGGATNIKKCNRFVDEIKTLKPDIVYTYGTPAALAIAGTTDEPNKEKYLWDIPIISGIIADPISSKIIYDLKDTGRNLTGVNHIPDYDSQVSAMQSYLPMKKIGIFYSPSEKTTLYNVAAIKKACISKNIQPVEFPFEHVTNGKLDESKLEEAFKEIKAAGIDMVYLPSSNMLNAQSGPICDAAHGHKLLTYIVSDGMLTKNATPLMGLIAYRVNVGRLMAVKAEQILFENKTTRQIPYDRLEKFSFFVMKKIMLQLGIYPPLMTLNRASFIGTQQEEKKKKAQAEEERKKSVKGNDAESKEVSKADADKKTESKEDETKKADIKAKDVDEKKEESQSGK
jgi:putative ABC transport system substrate-binding protein